MRTKQTAHGSKSQRPKGMATATFPSSTKADPEQQGAGEDTEDSQDWPDMLVEAMEEHAGTSKSKGETGDQPQQAEGGAPAPPEEIPPATEPSDPKPGISKDPTDAPTEAPTQDPTLPHQDPKQPANEDTPPDLTNYVKAYKQAGKVW